MRVSQRKWLPSLTVGLLLLITLLCSGGVRLGRAQEASLVQTGTPQPLVPVQLPFEGGQNEGAPTPQVHPTPSPIPSGKELLVVRLWINAPLSAVRRPQVLKVVGGIQKYLLRQFRRDLATTTPPPITLTFYEPDTWVVLVVEVPSALAEQMQGALTEWIERGGIGSLLHLQTSLVDEQVSIYNSNSSSSGGGNYGGIYASGPQPSASAQAIPEPTPPLPQPSGQFIYLQLQLYIQAMQVHEFTESLNELFKAWLANHTDNLLRPQDLCLTILRSGSVYATYTTVVQRGTMALRVSRGLEGYLNSGEMTVAAGVPIQLIGGQVESVGLAPNANGNAGGASLGDGPGGGGGGGTPGWVIPVSVVLGVMALAAIAVAAWVLWGRRRERRHWRAYPELKYMESLLGDAPDRDATAVPEVLMDDEMHGGDGGDDDNDDDDAEPEAMVPRLPLAAADDATYATAPHSPAPLPLDVTVPLLPPSAPPASPSTSYPSAPRRHWQISESELQLFEVIGVGGFGTVHRALWRGAEVAVKRSLLQRGLSTAQEHEFFAECDLMANLRHPCVLQFLAAVIDPPNLLLVVELMPRGSLFDILHSHNHQSAARRPRLPWRRRLSMMQDAARGMAYLHACRPPIIHRDLKSMNCLVNENWRVKVSDFGLSRVKHNTFLTSRMNGGTPEWTAPEVIRNERHDEKCDVYSFGVVAWEMITRRIPFQGMKPVQVLAAVGFKGARLGIPAVPSGAQYDDKRAFVELIRVCLQEQPDRRPSMAAVYTELVRIERELGPRALSISRQREAPARKQSAEEVSAVDESSTPTAVNADEEAGAGRPLALAPLDMSGLPVP